MCSWCVKNSKIAVSTEPKCYLDTGVCKVTWSPDSIRTASLYTPATLLISLVYVGLVSKDCKFDFNLCFRWKMWFNLFAFQSYEILTAVGLNLNPLIALLVGVAPISTISKSITENIFFKDPFIVYGACPTCGVENRVFFGDVLGVQVK